jgi:hypothetical protein
VPEKRGEMMEGKEEREENAKSGARIWFLIQSPLVQTIFMDRNDEEREVR